MKRESRPPRWREWTLFGLKWLMLVVFLASIYISRLQSGADNPVAGLVIPAITALVVNLLLGLFILAAPRLVPVVIVTGDILLAALFTQASGGDPMLIAGIAGALILSAVVRLGPFMTAMQAFGILIVVLVMRAIAPVSPDVASGVPFSLLLFLVGFAVVAVGASYALEQHVHERSVLEAQRGEAEQVKAMRDRTRAIYELSSGLSSTLNYDRILNVALDVGRLGLRSVDGQGYVSAVLLHRAADNSLYVAASRRLTRSDDAVIIHGAEGMVGEALRESTPVFANHPRKDPELQHFSAIHYCKSVLVIPLRSEFENYGVLIYGSEKPDAFDNDQGDLLLAIASQATIALQNAVLYRSLLEEKNRIVEVEEDARKKLARDLHDGPTQSVAAIAMRMSYLSRLLEKNPEQVEEELIKVEDLARRTAKEIRHMLFTLRPLALETQGLTAALSQLAQKMQETHGQAVSIKVGKDVEKVLDPQQQGVLFYIVEEATNNARKHAQADLITVTVNKQENAVVCQIADNGLGFNPHSVSAGYDKRGSLGMLNMRERTDLLNGQLRVDSVEGKGTVISILIPLNQGSTLIRESSDSRPRPVTKLAVDAIERVNSAVVR